MYEGRTKNYDPEIQEEYLIHDTPFLLPHKFRPTITQSPESVAERVNVMDSRHSTVDWLGMPSTDLP